MVITSQNSDKRAVIRSKIKLLDMDEKIYNIPDINFDSYITMPSSDFQTYIIFACACTVFENSQKKSHSTLRANRATFTF